MMRPMAWFDVTFGPTATSTVHRSVWRWVLSGATAASAVAHVRRTVRGLTDVQAAQRTTVSELCAGGLIKHVATVEDRWMRFAVGGPKAMESEPVDWKGQFRMLAGETLAGLLDTYEQVAGKTDGLVSTLPGPSGSRSWSEDTGPRTAQCGRKTHRSTGSPPSALGA